MKFLLILLLSASVSFSETPSTTRPNVIVIFIDDMDEAQAHSRQHLVYFTCTLAFNDLTKVTIAIRFLI